MTPSVGLAAVAILHTALACGVTVHVLLTKADVRSAISWIGLAWLAPVVGAILYFFFGVNRIRRASRSGRVLGEEDLVPTAKAAPLPGEVDPAAVPESFFGLAVLVGRVTGARLTRGNSVDPLIDGDAAYPAMLAAIDGAQCSVALASYIFDHGVVADRFVAALDRATQRGVAVRVLIDAVGARYSSKSVVAELGARGIPAELFLPVFTPIVHSYFDLRNHRKLMIADGSTAFCGGLNIRDACMLSLAPASPTHDIHFRVQGPVVRQLMAAFALDWKFTTGETLDGEAWFPVAAASAGDVITRGIPTGPDEDFEHLTLTFLGAIGQARKSIRIVTPYFLPDASLFSALRVAALRGVRVELVIPEHGNQRIVQWAQTSRLVDLIAGGSHVFATAAPFDHSKMFVVDGEWSLIGSANWDSRSLRLNFEYVVECYSPEFAVRLNAIIDAKLKRSREVTRAELDGRSVALKLRDAAFWLMQLYL